jgi:hypothetical protein
MKKEKQKNDNNKYEQGNQFHNFININTGNANKSKISIKKNDLDIYYKKMLSDNDTDTKDNTYFYEINSKKDDSIQSQKLKYINILDELSQSVSSSSKSNFSMKNINSYSKKTHRTKFCSNHSNKNSSSNKKNENNENDNKYISKSKKRK